MNECIFCKIIEKEIPSSSIYEDEHVFAVLDIHPCSLGHTVVLPKVHAKSIIDLPDLEVEYLFLSVKNITKLLLNKLSPDGFTIGINHGESAGQAVPHLHVHIIPRWADDNGSSIHSVVRNTPKESIEEIKKKICS